MTLNADHFIGAFATISVALWLFLVWHHFSEEHAILVIPAIFTAWVAVWISVFKD